MGLITIINQALKVVKPKSLGVIIKNTKCSKKGISINIQKLLININIIKKNSRNPRKAKKEKGQRKEKSQRKEKRRKFTRRRLTTTRGREQDTTRKSTQENMESMVVRGRRYSSRRIPSAQIKLIKIIAGDSKLFSKHPSIKCFSSDIEYKRANTFRQTNRFNFN